jgi:serine/threonine protein kinase
LAATTFHLLTGAPPFHDSNPAVVISNHLSSPPPRLSDRRPDLAHLDAVLATALAKDPDQRYPRCLDFARALAAQQAGRRDPTAPTARPTTQRLERLTVHGTARGVEQNALGAQHQAGILELSVVPSDGRAPVPVELQTQLVAGQLADGDEVEVSGVWDGNTLDADTIINLSAGARQKRRRSPTPAKPPGEKSPRNRKGRIGALAAVVAVIVLAAAAVLFFTDGFGTRTRPGPIVKPESATVFSPNGAADNPQDAGLAIDGDPDTSWSTVTYRDPIPFPNFIEGMGLMLHLPKPTELSAVTIDLSSTGTEVQIRSSDSETPNSLADTTELTPTTSLQPGHNRIEVRDRAETSNVLVWITTLGTTDGQSRTEISEITLQSAG